MKCGLVFKKFGSGNVIPFKFMPLYAYRLVINAYISALDWHQLAGFSLHS